mmetsp:Transcript_26328/g.28328  ORF Transcript_26328/g.28328 Transcript_26328/m.28328 type:complete len:85 (+) Transcript_26328:1-255(+)
MSKQHARLLLYYQSNTTVHPVTGRNRRAQNRSVTFLHERSKPIWDLKSAAIARVKTPHLPRLSSTNSSSHHGKYLIQLQSRRST